MSFIIVATRASSQYVRASPSTYKRTKSSHCSITAPVLTLKWNEIKRGWKVERFLILFSDAVCKKTGCCKCEISHRAQRDAESQMAVDASSFRSAVNSNSLAILLQGSGHFQIALSLCIGVCGTLKWFFSSVLHLREYLLLLRLLVMPSRLQSLPLWSLLFSLLVFTCGSNGSYFALCFWQTPVFWIIMCITKKKKYPGHYCAGLLMWSWFKLWSNPANHLSLSYFSEPLLLFHYVPAPSFIYTVFPLYPPLSSLPPLCLLYYIFFWLFKFFNMTPSDYSSCRYHFLPSPNTVFCHLLLPASCFTLLHTPAHHLYLFLWSYWQKRRSETDTVLKRKISMKNVLEIRLYYARSSSVVCCGTRWCECDASPSLVGCMSQRQALSPSYADRKSKRQIRYEMKAYEKEHKLMIRSKEYVERKE